LPKNNHVVDQVTDWSTCALKTHGLDNSLNTHGTRRWQIFMIIFRAIIYYIPNFLSNILAS